MSKVIKLKQEDIEKIVKNVINEQSKENNEEEVTEESGEVDYEIEGEPGSKEAHMDIFLGKDENGEIYVVNARTGDVLGHKKF
jgi:hypothetical protein